MIEADYHVHTNFSIDSHAAMEEMIQAAIKSGVKELCFTDHVDFIYPNQINYDIYIPYFERLKEKYEDSIMLRLGVEIGLGPFTNKENTKLINKYLFDFVIGSSHDIDGKDLYIGEYFKGKPKKQAYIHYFEEVLDNIKTYHAFSVYGHLDVIVRYGRYANNDIDYNEYALWIDEILKLLIQKDKGIELNTSGFRYGLGHTHPKADILKRYKELGGKIITVGSDAHRTADIARDFQIAETILKDIGFSEICVFEKQKLNFVQI